jgi:cell pole-organizing protein PopZ
MRQEGEPSVEEILESIKKVIARDNRDSFQAERRHRATVGIDPEPAEPAYENEADEVLELDQAAAELPATNDFADGDDDAPQPATLTTESAARSMRESLAALAMIAEPGVPPQIVRSGETSLEGLTRELLRPMLAQWLDQNLPAMVERLVRAEIARIAGKRG